MNPGPHERGQSDPKLPRRITCPRCHGKGKTYQRLRGLIPCVRCGGKNTVVVLDTIRAEPGAELHPILRLSRLQKWILRKLARFGQAPFGISTKVLRKSEPKTGADNAAFARSLSRLEKRLLVIRTNHRTGIPGFGIIRTKSNQPPVRRTSHVILTSLGWRVACSLHEFPDRRRRRRAQSSPNPA